MSATNSCRTSRQGVFAEPQRAGAAWRLLVGYRTHRREFGPGKLSAFTLGYQPYAWSVAEANWRTLALADLILYEVNIAELGGDLERIRNLLAYLGDLGVNAIEVMPLSNVAVSVDWGYLPIGYFGVDERFGKRFDFQQLVDEAYQRGIAVIVNAVYGHTGAGYIRSISLNT